MSHNLDSNNITYCKVDNASQYVILYFMKILLLVINNVYYPPRNDMYCMLDKLIGVIKGYKRLHIYLNFILVNKYVISGCLLPSYDPLPSLP